MHLEKENQEPVYGHDMFIQVDEHTDVRNIMEKPVVLVFQLKDFAGD